VSELADAVARASQDATEGERRVAVARDAAKDARTRELEAVDHASTLGARRAVLERMERDHEGAEPAVAAVLSLGDEGVLGTLPDFFTVEGWLATAVERYLGPLVHALVVQDGPTVSRLSKWFRSTWTGGGGLILLPLDRAPHVIGASPWDPPAPTSLRAHVAPTGEGAPWVRTLLDGVDVIADGHPGALDPARAEGSALVTTSGTVLEARGIVRIGNPMGGTGALTRKEDLLAAAEEHERALEVATVARAGREAAERTAAHLEALQDEARAAVREAEEAARRSEAELGIHAEMQKRAEQRREDLSRQIEGVRAARTRTLARAQEAMGDREVVIAGEAEVGRARQAAVRDMEASQAEWDTVRAEETRLAVELARVEGEAQRLSERLEAVRSVRNRLRERLAALDSEEHRVRVELEESEAVCTAADDAMAGLFAERDRIETAVRAKQSDLETATEARSAAESGLREVRAAERAASERRHALELERQDLTGRIERIRERVEGEWGRTLERLAEEAESVEGDPDQLAAELRDLAAAIEALGPVNELAVEEHEEESKRLEFLTTQRDDLVTARNDLRSAIRDINRTAMEIFSGTFERIREKFKETFLRLFEDGHADIRLADPDDPLESAIDIHASPRGKKTQRIELLSGGERAMVALALLFGIYLVKPSPFCVLDEVDSPLDEGNVGQFIKLIEDFKATTQFVVMTHNPRTITAADWIYGVTMEEPDVSMIVGVRLEDALAAADGADVLEGSP
jgi:chromosome segregation protein